MNNKELMEEIYNVEGFTVHIDNSMIDFKSYYKRSFNDLNGTVSQWRKKFEKRYPNCTVVIHKGNGDIAHGRMFITNVRDSYYLTKLREEIESLKAITHIYEEQLNSYNTDHVDSDLDPYEVLGVDRDCDFAEIKEAYRRLCNSFHTDKLSQYGLHADLLQFATKKMQVINVAFRQIRDEENCL